MEKLQATGFWVELDRLTPARMLVPPHAHAASTSIKYIATYKRWQPWAKCQLVPALPADSLHVGLYLTFLPETTKSRSAIEAALYGIKWTHKMCCSPDPTGHSLPTMVLEAEKILMGKSPIPEAPITS